jgi:hypothetical protein
MLDLRERSRIALVREPERGTIKVLLARDLVAERRDRRFLRPTQHDRVVIALFHRAQEDRILVFRGGEITEAVDIEGAGCREIAYAELDMAGADDVERRGEVRLADGHGRFLFIFCPSS